MCNTISEKQIKNYFFPVPNKRCISVAFNVYLWHLVPVNEGQMFKMKKAK